MNLWQQVTSRITIFFLITVLSSFLSGYYYSKAHYKKEYLYINTNEVLDRITKYYTETALSPRNIDNIVQHKKSQFNEAIKQFSKDITENKAFEADNIDNIDLLNIEQIVANKKAQFVKLLKNLEKDHVVFASPKVIAGARNITEQVIADLGISLNNNLKTE